MIIKDGRNLVPTKFKDLNMGDVYKLEGQGKTLMKIARVCLETDETMQTWNCVCLNDGGLKYIYDETEVFKLKAELQIWDWD